jgi:hypothetical protein
MSILIVDLTLPGSDPGPPTSVCEPLTKRDQALQNRCLHSCEMPLIIDEKNVCCAILRHHYPHFAVVMIPFTIHLSGCEPAKTTVHATKMGPLQVMAAEALARKTQLQSSRSRISLIMRLTSATPLPSWPSVFGNGFSKPAPFSGSDE